MSGLTPGDPLGGPPGPPSEGSRSAWAPPTRGGTPPAVPPAAPPRPHASGPAAPGAPLVLAAWGPRAAASLIDGVIVGIVAGAVLGALGVLFGIGFLGGAEASGFFALVAALVVAAVAVGIAALLYAPAVMAVTGGRTLGKLVMGIRVVRVDGGPVDFGYAVVREALVKGLGLAFAAGLTGGLALLADLLWPLWDDQNRALHDMVVRSRVVRA